MAHSLSQSMTTAEQLRTLDMNIYQPLAASAVEICSSSSLVSNRAADKLPCFAVDQTAILINGMAKLDDIRRHIEQMSQPTLKKNKLISAYKFRRDASRLKTGLKGLVHTLIYLPINSRTRENHPRRNPRAATGVICDAPVFNALKPVIGITTTICDTAKCAESNRDAALALAAHANAVTKCIVERASTEREATAPRSSEALIFCSALENIHSYLISLKTRRGHMASWVLANQQKDRSAQLATALDKVLALFTFCVVHLSPQQKKMECGRTRTS
ncbi:hypothetical protein DFH08DRAFT_939014 [Mycena albidolilacea]|uniref:Uncharacterized protein n=1 Tax=Mycena albidolilacea TaxID=1033008 RepID=A0AAD6ZSY8_9AGAR|nr:hypothetical protein DFH08DRAFT_939014 [Mycena albidolilacea]